MKNALKQELREKAKTHKITMGVLSVRNNITEKQYVQSSLNMEALVNKIKFLLNGRIFTNPHLQNDWTEQGSENFTFEFVTVIHPQDKKYINYRQEIMKAEKAYLESIDTEIY
ncbi:GIY-YIG nuclease family protein [Elizabethkingia anophelis]|uniref:LuxR family transcriptional regulator n=1 Tax=Elizabethkingia anophelis TaxID=1117645 RepID=A0AAU8V2A2_9FLAO|nr:GIY-YIG nuclease family protein [Elizabethkingia anophelis]AMR43276.1 LuxR family transcriptional regulator [Elizabethkingia anophelis]AMX49912.1 LuxR family transcriptional regulator [Elizabethkingia anophelis]AMX53305.1 LuxR family transcriptional regulator [Elizabethkingia anophelis]AMX56765.1 LuxR family transcriptional regulator [Elizabethkingia anophelis]AQW96185.1 LuxR family transcriptional regulator [Elizabethkingia anophelis]